MIVGFETPPYAERINLDVDATFSSRGTLIPRKVLYDKRHYPVSRVVGQRPFSPEGITCADPIEYTTIIRGKKKKLYYEPSTSTWFSVKWRPRQYFPVCALARR